MKSLAIVAPDTDAGKTVITAALLKNAKKIVGKSTVMKPVQTGSILVEGRRVSPDISEIEQLTGVTIPRDLYHHVSPYNFLTPCSPHLAAQKEIGEIRFENIARNLEVLNLRFRLTLVETAGGVLSPLTESETNLDLVHDLGMPTVVVAQNRLGAISGTLATVKALHSKNVEVRGIVLIDPPVVQGELEKEILENNRETIAQFASVADTVRVPYFENIHEDFDVLTLLLEEFAERVFNDGTESGMVD
jgi:dethiobiotin synthetase